jgi:hypothetical protein
MLMNNQDLPILSEEISLMNATADQTLSIEIRTGDCPSGERRLEYLGGIRSEGWRRKRPQRERLFSECPA